MSLTSLPKEARLLKRPQFLALRRSRRMVSPYLLIEYAPSDRPRLGITVTRRYGPAVRRNRFKRIVREGFRQTCASFKAPYDLNIRPGPDALAATSAQIAQALTQFFCI